MRIRVEEERAERILIVGCSGSGKSTFSKALGEALRINVYHLDRYFWKSGWVPREKSEWDEIVMSLISKNCWIIEGNYARTFQLRARRATKIFLFDYPTAKNLYRVYKRVFKTKFKIEKRTDTTEGCEEKWFDREFYKWILGYRKRVKPEMYRIMEEINFDKDNLIIFKTNKDVKHYLHNLS